MLERQHELTTEAVVHVLPKFAVGARGRYVNASLVEPGSLDVVDLNALLASAFEVFENADIEPQPFVPAVEVLAANHRAMERVAE